MPPADGTALPWLRLLQLVSPSLPVGGFTYSQGLEWAVETGWIRTADDLDAWLADQLQGALVPVDLALLLRLHAAATGRDLAAVTGWTDTLLAMRETAELRLEEANRGRALADLLVAFDLIEGRTAPRARRVPADRLTGTAAGMAVTRTRSAPALPSAVAPFAAAWRVPTARSQLAGFALAASAWGIGPQLALTGYAWAWLENLVLAGVKLVPLGQTDGQRVLARLAALIPDAVAVARTLPDDAIGAATPALAIASSNHEGQYTRLFRS